jgi:hypothetical protein
MAGAKGEWGSLQCGYHIRSPASFVLAGYEALGAPFVVLQPDTW